MARPDIARLAQELMGVGKRAGLAEVGFATASSFEQTYKTLLSRKRRGFSAGMNFTYRNPARSTNPKAALPSANSLIVGAYAYDGPKQLEKSEPRKSQPKNMPKNMPEDNRVKVGLYVTKDYYSALRTALGEVATRLKEEGYKALVLMDDNALVDREAAYRAGLGWYGKNTNLLLHGKGSWFVLGSILTDAKFEPATPSQETCGVCRSCITSCPTNAILESGGIDSRRCLAWLLQKEGVFPNEYRAALGSRIYGCDDCQIVCPINKSPTNKNRANKTSGASPKATNLQNQQTTVFELLELSDEDLMSNFGHWYIPKRDPKYIRRNALVVLGNIGEPEDVHTIALLRTYLSSPDALLRAHAVWATKRLERYELLEELSLEKDLLVLEELRRPVSV